MKPCPKCRWPKPRFGYEGIAGQFFVRCPACGYTSLGAHSRAVAEVFWQAANAPDQQGKLNIPL